MERRRDDVVDFLKVEDFAHGCERVYSPDRWAITGEAGVFLDPLYSPGSDYITISNTYVTDLIKRDLGGEDVSQLAETYSGGFIGLFEAVLNAGLERPLRRVRRRRGVREQGHLRLRRLLGHPGAARVLRQVHRPRVHAGGVPYLGASLQLAGAVQQLFRDWHELGPFENPTGVHAVTSTFPGMWDRLKELKAGLDEETLRDRYRTNVQILEAMAVVLFHKACRRLPEGPPDPERRIKPGAVSVHPERWEEDGLFDDENGLTLAEAYEQSQGFENMLLDELAARA